MSIDNLKSLKLELNNENEDAIEGLFEADTQRLITNQSILDRISQQDLRWLETQGYTITKFTEKNPLGTFAIDDFRHSRHLHRSHQIRLRQENDVIYRIQKHFQNGFGIVSQAPTQLSQQQIDTHAFSNIPTHAQVVSTYSQQSNNQWQQPIVVPSGRHIIESLNTSNQYAQGGFEGMIAMANSTGEVFTFRPFENAKRLQDTCRGLCIPEVPIEIFMESITSAVVANTSYIPSHSSNAKLYIRPYVQGINGGSGVAPASSYLFCVEVFPFAGYFQDKDFALDLVAIDGSRRSTPGGVGHLKYSGNYARTMHDKHLAKSGLALSFNNQKFHDLFYIGEHFSETSTNGIRQASQVIEEGAAGCLMFYQTTSDQTIFFTPSLDRNTILPSITRASIIELCKQKGHEVIETNIKFEQLPLMTGAMLIGSAAGAVRINSMSTKGQTVIFDSSSKAIEPFYDIYDSIYQIRRGNTQEFDYDRNLGLHSWPHLITQL